MIRLAILCLLLTGCTVNLRTGEVHWHTWRPAGTDIDRPAVVFAQADPRLWSLVP